MNNEEYIQKLTQELETYKQSEQEAKEIIAELKFKNKKLKDIIENKFEEENITDTAVTYLNDLNIYLSKDNKRLKEKVNSLVENQGQLLAENKELKEQNKKYSAINEQETKDYAELTEKYNKMVKISEENLIKYEDLRLKNLKFEHALKEIKEIAENLSTYTASDERKLNKILNIISEVIGGKQCQQ